MRGTLTFKPIKANLTHDTEWITKMDPYVSFTLGSQQFKSQVCNSGGKNPVWSDQVQIPLDSDQQFCYLQIMDENTLSKDDNVGTATIDLFEVMNSSNRFVSKWYPIFYNNTSAGEILLEVGFSPSGQSFGNQPFVSGTQNITSGMTGQSGYGQSGYGKTNIGGETYSHNIPHSTGQTYSQSGLGTTNVGQSGLSTNVGQSSYGQGGLGTTNVGQTGYGQSGLACCAGGVCQTHMPLQSHGSVEDPLYGKTVDVKSAGVYSTGYQQTSNLGYQQGSNLSGQGSTLGQGSVLGQGTNLDYQQGSNIGYGQGGILGQGTNFDYQQGSNVGYGQGSTLGQGGILGQGSTLGQGTNLDYQQGSTLSGKTNYGTGTGTGGFVDNTLGRVGQKINDTIARHNPHANPSNVNENLGGPQFTQPGLH